MVKTWTEINHRHTHTHSLNFALTSCWRNRYKIWLAEQNDCCALRFPTHLPRDVDGHSSVKTDFSWASFWLKSQNNLLSLPYSPFLSALSLLDPSRLLQYPLLLFQAAWACYGHRLSPVQCSVGRGVLTIRYVFWRGVGRATEVCQGRLWGPMKQIHYSLRLGTVNEN